MIVDRDLHNSCLDAFKMQTISEMIMYHVRQYSVTTNIIKIKSYVMESFRFRVVFPLNLHTVTKTLEHMQWFVSRQIICVIGKD